MEITYSRTDLQRLMLNDAGVREDEVREFTWNFDGSLTVRFSVRFTERDALAKEHQ